ncbi:MAG: adenylosuccinate synthase [Planctomycetota bacterium]|jgi:adenylosuccinate synthase
MSPSNVTVVGLQWGDEGKGKVVDALAGLCRYVVRYCGGANAGHTVLVGEERFALHLIPCGILREGVINIVGNGVAFDPAVAMEEITDLRDRGVAVGPDNLRISSAAQVVLPYHKLQDSLSEKALAGKKLGTTARGIGPCYADKAIRSLAIRAGDLADPAALADKLKRIIPVKDRVLGALYDAEPLDEAAIIAEYTQLGEQLAPMICNTAGLLRNGIAAGERAMFEGGQGSMLDVDHGTYPFVTSSAVTACGVPQGAGVPPSAVGTVIGVVKAYGTRVGAGPFPTEQDNAIGNTLRERGHEYGTTTGRPRRCGWLDAAAVRFAADLSGVDEIALALLDVLSGLDELQICTGYRVGGELLKTYDPTLLAQAEPVYETLSGWSEEIDGCESFDALPAAAQAYVSRVEDITARPVGVIGVGAERQQTIIHHSTVEGLA